jgi:MoaA/NifB/PqqE/SkfB family radical SAM enzyme
MKETLMKSLTINVFFKCNARCIFCVVGLTGGDQTTGELPLEQVGEELRRGYELGCRSVTFSGGEPTVYKGLAEAVRTARDLGYRGVEIKTNGIRLGSKEIVCELVEAGVDLFSISIHGPDAETHDWLVGVPRAFERAVAGARHVRELGAQLSLPTCIQRGNYERLPETVGMLVGLGPRFLLPTFIEPSGSAAFRFDDVVPRYSEVRPYVREVGRMLAGQDGFAWAFHGFPMCMLDGYEQYSYDLVRGEEVVGASSTEDYYGYERTVYRTKSSRCRQCQLQAVCGGPWREYVDRRGWDEFEPVEDRGPLDVIPLRKLARALFVQSQPAEQEVRNEIHRC